MDTLIATEKMVSLAPLTTLELGGAASELVRITSSGQAAEVVRWWRALPADSRSPLLPLGGGSNLLVSDSGFRGLVLKMENREFEVLEESESRVVVRVGAGMIWDDFVARAVKEGWAGVECLSGIPGSVGAAPVQNIGAYGQEVAEVVLAVQGIDCDTGEPFERDNSECEFCYRDSYFKRSERGRYLITAVTFALRAGGEPTIRYQDLLKRCDERDAHTLDSVRGLVLEIRRSKSMVYDKTDQNHRSAGSFFTNPIVPEEVGDRIRAELEPATRFPCFPHGEGMVKLSAAWLIDNAGMGKGFRHRPDARVGLSTNHVLALTNRGGATSAELLELSAHVQRVVKERFGVTLVPEPVFVGF